MLIILHYIKFQKLITLVLLVAIVAFVELVVLRELSLVLNYYLGSGTKVKSIDLIILFCGSFLKLLLGPGLTFFIYKTSLDVQLRVSSEIACKALNVDENVYNSYPAGHWMNVANVETAQFCTGFINSHIFRAAELIILSAMLTFLFLNLNLSTILLILPLVIMSAPLIIILRKYVREWGIDRQIYENQRIQILKDLISARNIIINTKFSDSFKNRYKQTMAASNAAQVKRFVGMSLPRYTMEVMCALILAYPILTEAFFQTSSSVDINELALFGVAMLRIMPSLNKIISTTNEISFSTAPLNILEEFNNLPETKRSEYSHSIESEPLVEYESRRFKLSAGRNLEFSILEGDIISITGPSGVGKSTVLKHLAGLIVDDQDTKLQFKKGVQIGYVSQEPYAYSGTLKYNVFGNNTTHTQQRFDVKLEDYGLDYLRWDEEIGDGGRKLSGGELMRVNLMRAILSGANIICLDETLSALPKSQRSDIMQFIKNSGYFLAIIYVTHVEDDLVYANKTLELHT